PQRPRVPGGDARRLEGPGRGDQRQLPLRRRRAGLRPGRQRRPGGDLPRRLRGHAGRGPARPAGRGAAAPGRRRLRRRAAARGRGPGPTGDPRAAAPPGPPAGLAPADRYVLYTGGTTGQPKGTLWRQGDFLATALGVTGTTAEVVATATARAGLRTLPSAPF